MAKAPAAPVDEFDDQSFYVRSSRGELLKVLLLGIAVGLLVPLLSFLLEKFFIEPVFCRSADSFGVCATGGLTAYYIATALVSVLAIVLLANWQVFRPLLIVVGVAAAGLAGAVLARRPRQRSGDLRNTAATWLVRAA